MTSIRSRLLASVAAIQIAGACLATYLVVHHERHQSYIAFDARLGEEAAVLRSLVEAPEEAGDAIIFHREFMTLPHGSRFSITGPAGARIDGSEGWPEIRPLPHLPRSLVNLQVDKTRYRALVLQNVPVVDTDFEPKTASPTLTLVYAAPIAPLEAHMHEIEFQSIAACIALLAASTLISVLALTRGLRPLRELAAGAEKIDVGHWSLLDLEKSRQVEELKPLALALGDLVTRLQGAFEREQQFFGDAAHEMKSSVAIVRSTLQFALQSDRSAGEYKAELQGALADTQRLQELVASMLQLARIESIGRSAPSTDEQATELHAGVRRVMDRIRPLASEKKILLVVDAEAREIWARVPEEDFTTVLSNVIENAILFSDQGGEVTITLHADNDACRLTVSDAGCGIAPSALPHIFDRFYRGDASRSRASGGVGLGLSITQAFLSRANGTISVQSQLGKGSLFTIMLPAARPST